MELRSGFMLQVGQNKYLPAKGSEMHVILTVTARDLGRRPEAAEVIIVDCSTSMESPQTKIVEARRATVAAIDRLPDGTFFAVVEGTERARVVYPPQPGPGLVPATPQARADAAAEVKKLFAGGGTAMGRWLTMAGELLDQRPDAIRHAILLTDGKNEHDEPGELDQVLDACADRFVCDARGIGDGWEPGELHRIVGRLRGTADAVREDSELEADFREMAAAAMRKVVPDLEIRVRFTFPGTRVRFLKQVFRTRLDLAGFRKRIDDRTVAFATGPWASGEIREYHLCLEIEPGDREIGEDVQLATVDLAASGERRGGPVPVLAHWTDDERQSTVINDKMEHYLVHDRLTEVVNAGCDAYEAGRPEDAAMRWGEAARLAGALNNEKILRRLQYLVELRDIAEGKVRIKPDIRPVDVKRARLGSTYSSLSTLSALGPASSGVPAPDRMVRGATRACPECGHAGTGDAVFCMRCGSPLDAGTGPLDADSGPAEPPA